MRPRQALSNLALSFALALVFAPRIEPLLGSEGLPSAPEEVSDALLAGDHAQAVERIDEILRRGDRGPTDYLVFLKGLSLAHLNRPEEAAAVFRQLCAEHPQSLWLHKAQFHLAEALRQLRQFREAEEIYESEARRLLAEGRKQELAEVYFGFADRLSRPEDPSRPDAPKPDYPRAYVLYQKALDLEPPAQAREHALFRLAHCAEALKNWAGAELDYNRYLDELDPSRRPEGSQLPSFGRRVFEARFRLGEVLLAAGRADDARRQWQDLEAALASALAGEGVWARVAMPLDDARRDELRRLRADALHGVSRTHPRDSAAGVLLANAALEKLLSQYPADDKAPLAAFTVASNLLGVGRDEEALRALERFLAGEGYQLASAKAREEAAALKMRAAYLRGQVLSRQEKYEEAIRAWTDYVGLYPNGPDWSQAQQRIVEAEFLTGMRERTKGDFAAARKTWLAFLDRHPLSQRARQVPLLLGELFVEEAQALLGDRDASKIDASERTQHDSLLRAAVDQWEKVVSKHPGSAEASQALFRAGEVLEDSLRDLDAAIDAYRRLTWGPHAAAAKSRLERMTARELAVSTERVWRSHEPARVRLELRNLDKVGVQVYRIDLEAYFRKHQDFRGVEALDLDLIQADQSFEVLVQDYARYLPIAQEVELPVSGPGVWAVAVTAEKLRATTLVLRSDIDIVVKSSRRELFVFAEDMVAKTPRAGVRVLAIVPRGGADAELATIEGRTGDDGVFFFKFRQERGGQGRGENVRPLEADRVSVLASTEGHSASNVLDLHGLGFSQGLEPRGLVYTDRPIYRPGQEVHLRAILREARAGAYVFEKGREYRLAVADSQGRVFHTAALRLSDFGTVHESFRLDPLAPVGSYVASLQAAEGPVFSGGFQVEEYKVERIELSFELPRRVYYRGEAVEGDVRARYYYGEPLADAALRYVLPDGRTLTARTDGDGKVPFRFDTSSLAAEGVFTLQASLTEEQVNATANVYLAVHAYTAAVSTLREVYLAGEPFDVAVSAKAPTGEPVEADLKLSLVRRERAAAKGGARMTRGETWTEVLAGEFRVRTDPKSGSALQSVRADKGGRYILRAEGTDRFGNTVSAERAVFISDREDQVALRILSDTQHLKVGEKAEVRLVLRGEPGLALVTFEGEEILDYRLVQLAEGPNPLSFEVRDALFPNFALAASVLGTGTFHEAHTEFDVRRGLKLTVRADKETYAPGETAVVDLEVTDQAGRPARAEVSVAAVDDALLALSPLVEASLEDYFSQGAHRVAALRTTASSTFRYQGVTKTLSGAVWEELQLGAVRSLSSQVQAQQGEGPAGTRLRLGSVSAEFGAIAQVPLSLQGVQTDEEIPQVVVFYGTLAEHGTQDAKTAARARFLETAFWAPAVVTDAQGRARVSFQLPDQATRWRLFARGVTETTSLGEAAASVVAREDFFLELKLPASLTEGDRPRFVARVHNLTGKRGEVQLQLRLRVGERSESLPARIEVAPNGVSEHLFAAVAALPAVEKLHVEAEAVAALEGAERRDKVVHELAVRPWGLEFFASDSGLLSADAAIELELPPGRTYGERSLEIVLGGGVDHVLVEEALGGPAAGRHFRSSRPATHADAASELLGVAAVLETAAGHSADPAAVRARLSDRGQALAAQLVAAQREDGGWTWAGQKLASDPGTSAMAMWALGLARRLGLTVPPSTIEKGQAFLLKAFSAAPHEANEVKAMLLHALAVHRAADFAFANRLYRSRQALSPAALAYTTLTLVEMDHAPMAAELAALLEKHAELVPGTGGAAGKHAQSCWRIDGNDAFNRSPLEMTALAVLALERAAPRSELAARGAEHLLATRPWHPAKARGPILAALAAHHRRSAEEALNAEVSVAVGGRSVETVRLSGAESKTVSVPAALLTSDRARVELRLQGRGQPSYSAVLRAFSRDLAAKDSSEGNGLLQIRGHVYSAAPPSHRGRDIPTGFDIIEGRFQRWENTVRQLGLGALTHVRVEVEDRRAVRSPRPAGDYLVIEVPLPAGATVLEGSLAGASGHVQVEDGRLTFFVTSTTHWHTLRYTLLGYLPGQYRVLPAVVRSAFDPAVMAAGKPAELDVLARGEASSDPYRPTPVELLHLGKVHFDEGLFDKAEALLEKLYSECHEQLTVDSSRETVRMLLFTHLARQDAAGVVKYFEIVKEKYPELTVPFEKVLQVGEAYRKLEEFERALLVFRAAIEETFGKDLKVAGTLEEQGEFLGTARTLGSLWIEFPDLPIVVQSYLTLADQYFRKAPAAAEDPELKKAGLGREQLLGLAVEHETRFLHLYPRDPLLGEAALSLVSSYLVLEDYRAASRFASKLQKRVTDPALRDHFTYSQAVASWYLGDYEAATSLARTVAESHYTDSLGRRVESENRSLALYIIGQIYHALRRVPEAIEHYERVKDEFPDAREAIAHFRRKRLGVDELTTARPGEEVKVSVRFRNLKEAEVLAYSVDLMTLYLREKNLSRVSAVNLAGITPVFRRSVALGEGVDASDQEKRVTLPLSKAGAYLVIARGGDLHVSGLVLLTPLKLDVSTEAASGRVRVNVQRQDGEAYVRGAEVKVVGSASGEFVSGASDPRGLFVADGVAGLATVIAREGKDHYAFYRGSEHLGAAPPPTTEVLLPPGAAAADSVQLNAQQLKAQQQSVDWFSNVMGCNDKNVFSRDGCYKVELQKERKGVQAAQAK